MKLIKTIQRKSYRFTLTLFLLTFQFLAIAQELKTYKGAYNWGENEGVAEYTYYDKNGIRLFHGNFKFTSSVSNANGYADVVTTGQFNNGEVNGSWRIQLTGKAQNYSMTSVLTGQFTNGQPNGAFTQRIIMLDSIVTKMSYKNGKPYGKLSYYHGFDKETLTTQFAENGMLTGTQEYTKSIESEITEFDDQNRAHLIRQFSNGQEFKRVDAYEKTKEVAPEFSSWDTVSFKLGDKILERIWSKNNFGHLDGIGSLKTSEYSKMNYVTFQRLVSFKDGNLYPIESWLELIQGGSLSHSQNSKKYDSWLYMSSNEDKYPKPEIRKYFIKSDLASFDSVNKLFRSINFLAFDKAFLDLQTNLQSQQKFHAEQQKKLNQIDSIYTEISAVKIGNVGFEQLKKDPNLNLTVLSNNEKTAIVSAAQKKLESPYKLSEWKAKQEEIDAIQTQAIWDKTDTVTPFLSEMKRWISEEFIPWLTKDKEINDLISSNKDFEDLKRVYLLLIEEEAKRTTKLELGELKSRLAELKRIQATISSLVQQPTENYKPIRRDLKKAESVAEIKTLLKL